MQSNSSCLYHKCHISFHLPTYTSRFLKWKIFTSAASLPHWQCFFITNLSFLTCFLSHISVHGKVSTSSFSNITRKKKYFVKKSEKEQLWTREKNSICNKHDTAIYMVTSPHGVMHVVIHFVWSKHVRFSSFFNVIEHKVWVLIVKSEETGSQTLLLIQD